MKKLFLICLLLLVGCQNQAENKNPSSNGLETVPSIAQPTITPLIPIPSTTPTTDTYFDEHFDEIVCDLDLTSMSTTMIFAQVNDFYTNGENYVDKIIKIKGLYIEDYREEIDTTYKMLIVSDVTGCCVIGVDVVLPDNMSYPSPGTFIALVGSIEVIANGVFNQVNFIASDMIEI